MTGLQDFRKQYPQYDNVPDDVLAEKLYEKHYRGRISKPEYMAKLGLTRDPAAVANTGLSRTLMAARAADPRERPPAPIPGDIPDLETADLTSPAPRKGAGRRLTEAATDVTRGTIDLLRSGAQRTSPVVRNIRGEYIRPYLGEFHDQPTSEGNIPMAFGPKGGVRIDPEKHVVLYDPVTRKDQVFLRTEKTKAGIAESVGHMLGAGAVTNAVSRLPGGVAAARAASPKAQLLEDYTRLGVRPSQPLISQGRATGTAAQALAKVPIAGEGVTRNLRKTFNDTVQAVDRVAESFGTPGTRDRAGRIIQGGIDRAGKVVGSAPDAASMPSRYTSFSTKADALYSRATGLVGKDATVSMTKTRAALEGILNRTGVESIDALLRNPELRGIAEALQETGELPFDAARQLRSKVGKLTRSGGDEVLRTIDKAEVARLYSAMTDDLMGAAQKAGGPQAAQALHRADQFYAAGNRRIEEGLRKLFKAESPEVAYERLMTMLSEKTAANMKAAYGLKRTLRPEEWNDIAATVIERMGKPTAGAAANLPGGEQFSISTFMTSYNRLSDKGKELLFGGPARKEIEALVRVVSSQKEFERLANTSNTAPNLMWMILPGAAVADFGTTATAVGTGRAFSELLMSPRFVRWLHQAGTIRLPSEAAIHMGSLQRLVQQEPHLAIPLQRLMVVADDDNEDRK